VGFAAADVLGVCTSYPDVVRLEFEDALGQLPYFTGLALHDPYRAEHGKRLRMVWRQRHGPLGMAARFRRPVALDEQARPQNVNTDRIGIPHQQVGQLLLTVIELSGSQGNGGQPGRAAVIFGEAAGQFLKIPGCRFKAFRREVNQPQFSQCVGLNGSLTGLGGLFSIADGYGVGMSLAGRLCSRKKFRRTGWFAGLCPTRQDEANQQPDPKVGPSAVASLRLSVSQNGCRFQGSFPAQGNQRSRHLIVEDPNGR